MTTTLASGDFGDMGGDFSGGDFGDVGSDFGDVGDFGDATFDAPEADLSAETELPLLDDAFDAAPLEAPAEEWATPDAADAEVDLTDGLGLEASADELALDSEAAPPTDTTDEPLDLADGLDLEAETDTLAEEQATLEAEEQAALEAEEQATLEAEEQAALEAEEQAALEAEEQAALEAEEQQAELRFGELQPNTTYERNGYTYETDDQGRVTQVYGDLHLGESHRTAHQTEVGHMGLEGDEGGHLVGARFGGSPEGMNLVPQNMHLNRSDWKVMENEWADALDQGKDVALSTSLAYDEEQGLAGRPSDFIVNYMIDGVTYTKYFPNSAEGSEELV